MNHGRIALWTIGVLGLLGVMVVYNLWFSQQRLIGTTVQRHGKRAPFGTVLGRIGDEIEVYSCDEHTLNRTQHPSLDHTVQGVYMGMKWQCVELARRFLFLRTGWVFESIPMAYQIFQLRSLHDPLVRGRQRPLYRCVNGKSGTAPSTGSLVIWDPVGYFARTGHVAVVVAVNESEGWVRIAEQNVLDDVWPPDRPYSRQLVLQRRSDTLAYEIRCTFTSTRIIGWMTLDLGG